MMIHKVNIVTREVSLEELPESLIGTDAETLQNLQSALNPTALAELGLTDIEFWPSVKVDQVFAFDKKPGAKVTTLNDNDKTVELSRRSINKTAGDKKNERDALKRKVYGQMNRRQRGNMTLADGSIIDIRETSLFLEKTRFGPTGDRKTISADGKRNTLSVAGIASMDAEIDNHLKALRDRAFDLYEAIDTTPNYTAIDIESGWPA